MLILGVAPHECASRWTGTIAHVPQDVAVLSGTVRENVALAIPSEFIDDSLVWEVLERAQLSTFLQESRERIDTSVIVIAHRLAAMRHCDQVIHRSGADHWAGNF